MKIKQIISTILLLTILLGTVYLGVRLANGDGIGYKDGQNRYWIFGHDEGCEDPQFKYSSICGVGTQYQEECCCSYRDSDGTGGICIPKSTEKTGRKE